MTAEPKPSRDGDANTSPAGPFEAWWAAHPEYAAYPTKYFNSQIAREAFAAGRASAPTSPGWRPIAELEPTDDQVLARTADGRVMVWTARILLGTAMHNTTPNHLLFPAIHFMLVSDLPPAPTVEGV